MTQAGEWTGADCTCRPKRMITSARSGVQLCDAGPLSPRIANVIREIWHANRWLIANACTNSVGHPTSGPFMWHADRARSHRPERFNSFEMSAMLESKPDIPSKSGVIVTRTLAEVLLLHLLARFAHITNTHSWYRWSPLIYGLSKDLQQKSRLHGDDNKNNNRCNGSEILIARPNVND